jgi:hypothetical protein
MHKRNITYEIFDENDNPVETTKSFYFGMSIEELMRLQVEYEGGYVEMMQEFLKAENLKELMIHFDTFILMAYGVKAEDGEFIKDEELTKSFKKSSAFKALFAELAMETDRMAEFLQACLPRELGRTVQKELAKELKELKAEPTPAV